MNCHDFKELSDSYLSDELLVETNHEVIHHLENCTACRQILASRRELRVKLRQSIKTSPEFQPNVTRLGLIGEF
jgi:predicted anti-sigma-YlaC factor YlaD